MLLLLTRAGSAQAPPPRASDGVATPAQPIASTDDASATLINPANLAFAAGPEGRFTFVYTGDKARRPVRGYAVDAAMPLWMLGGGLRVDWMDSPAAAPPPYANSGKGSSYTWVRWGAAARVGELVSFGTTLGWSLSDSADFGGMFSVTSGVTLRPNRFMSAALVARDWNTPVARSGRRVDPAVDMGLVFRPLDGDRMLDVGLQGTYRADVARWVPAFHFAVDIPYVGRFRSGLELLDPQAGKLVATTALDINIGSTQATAGAVFGSALGLSGTGVVMGGAIRGFQERPQVPQPARVVRLRYESTPSVRKHVALLRRLWQLADEREVAGVLLELRANPAPSLAHAEELVDALRLLKRHGKKVMCHLEDASSRQLYVCSEADRIAINPAGGLRFAGLSTRHLYFGGLLKKLGVRADFVRIGAHKLAPEQFQEGSSAVGKRDHAALLRAYESIFLRQLARGRSLTVAAAKAALAKGPFIATEARAAKLVDELVYDDEVERFVAQVMGARTNVVDDAAVDEAPRRWRSLPKVAVVYLHGNMVDGRSRTVPLIGVKLAGSYTIAKAMKQARLDRSVKAVVFRIETGGGSSLASDVILREVALTARVKPVIVSMGAAAASGGYYAAAAATEIFANRATLTGSIGIFYGKVDVVGMLAKLGVHSESLRTAPQADAESLFRPFTEEEHVLLGVKVKQFYDLFVGRVAEGRKLTPAQVHAVAQGKVWLGEQALGHHLVDKVGGFRQALARARQLAGLPADTPIVQLPSTSRTLFQQALAAAGVPSLQAQSPSLALMLPSLRDTAAAVYPMLMQDGYKPMAQMEMVWWDQP